MKFRKKPVIIDAIKFTGEKSNVKEILEFMGQKVDTSCCDLASQRFDEYCDEIKKNGIVIHTLEGDMTANLGDYIIKGVNGEFYPCKPDIFEKTYDKVEE